MSQKVAIIMGGLLGCHRLAIDSIMKNVVEPNNADVFVLTARRNYVHASTDELDMRNTELPFTQLDEDAIVNCFGSNLKFLQYSEDMAEYCPVMRSYCDLLKKNVSWIRGSDTRVERYDLRKETIVDEEKYLDQFLRQKFLISSVEDYEKANGFKYDYIIRLRIDQPIDKKLVDFKGESSFWWNGMDNFFYGSASIMKCIGTEFIERIGLFNVSLYKTCAAGDYRMTPEVQFIGFIESLSITPEQSFISPCWKFYKKDSACIVFDLSKSELERKSRGVAAQDFYKFEFCGLHPYYALFDTPRNVIWAYYLIDHSRRFSK